VIGQPSHSGRRRVILIEDSPAQAARLRAFFEADNLQMVRYSSAERALDQLETTRPDVIVLDCHLPGMNGNAFCREIRLNVDSRAVPVLMFTSEKNGAVIVGSPFGALHFDPRSAAQIGRRLHSRGRGEPLQPGQGLERLSLRLRAG